MNRKYLTSKYSKIQLLLISAVHPDKCDEGSRRVQQLSGSSVLLLNSLKADKLYFSTNTSRHDGLDVDVHWPIRLFLVQSTESLFTLPLHLFVQDSCKMKSLLPSPYQCHLGSHLSFPKREGEKRKASRIIAPTTNLTILTWH